MRRTILPLGAAGWRLVLGDWDRFALSVVYNIFSSEVLPLKRDGSFCWGMMNCLLIFDGFNEVAKKDKVKSVERYS